MKLINCTGHPIDVYLEGKFAYTLPVTKYCAFIKSRSKEIGTLLDAPIYNVKFLKVIGLPDPQEGSFLIVSAPVAAQALKIKSDRTDLLVPKVLKRKNNSVYGCSGFILRTKDDNIDELMDIF